MIYIHIICLDQLGFHCFAARSAGCLHCSGYCGSPIISHIIFNTSSNLKSGIPSSTGPSLGSTQNLCLVVLSVCLNITYTGLYAQYLMNYIFLSMTEFFMGHKAAIAALGNKVLKILNDIWLLLLQASILCAMCTF